MSASSDRYRFACTRCGDCCRWPGYVLLTSGDIARLAARFGMSEEAWIQRYTRLSPNRAQLALVDAVDGGCVFLAGNRCVVYAARPEQCRRFPFPSTTPAECPGLSALPAP